MIGRAVSFGPTNGRRDRKNRTFAWDASAEATTYRLYWGTATGDYIQSAGGGFEVGNVTSYFLPLLPLTLDVTYFMVVTAEDADGESDPSTEIQVRNGIVLT